MILHPRLKVSVGQGIEPRVPVFAFLFYGWCHWNYFRSFIPWILHLNGADCFGKVRTKSMKAGESHMHVRILINTQHTFYIQASVIWCYYLWDRCPPKWPQQIQPLISHTAKVPLFKSRVCGRHQVKISRVKCSVSYRKWKFRARYP